MVIKKVETDEEANKCDNLLTKLLAYESQFDENIKKDYQVKDYFVNMYNRKDCALFEAVEDDVIGYAFAKIVSLESGPDISKMVLLDGMFVEEEYRNKGIAHELIENVKMWCKENDISLISVNVLCKNSIPYNIYKEVGFEDFYVNMKMKI